MKTNVQILSGLLIATTVLFQTTSASAGILDILKGEKETSCECDHFQRVAFIGAAEVKEVTGKVEWLTGVNEWAPLPVGKKLAPGDMVRTKAGARVILKMTQSGSLIRATPNTIVRLVPLDGQWGAAALTGESESSGYVVRALRGEAEYLAKGIWHPLTMDRELAPGTKIRLVSGKQVDLFSREHGSVRLSERGEATLPRSGQAVTKQLKTAPVVALGK